MKKIITITHVSLTFALVVVVILTSYLSPMSQVGPLKRKISERMHQGFVYNDTYIYIRGNTEDNDKNRIVIGFDTLGEELNQNAMFLLFENGDRESMLSNHFPDEKVIAYNDEDGDGMPEKKVIKSGKHLQVFELEMTNWKLTKDNQSELSTPFAPPSLLP